VAPEGAPSRFRLTARRKVTPASTVPPGPMTAASGLDPV
jgi:hypothetical protein